jgi:large-conductance mechanosensitive channel
MATKEYDRYKNILSFILSERILTITVLLSIFTFQFISSFKICIVDPLVDFVLASDNFDFMSVTIRDGVEYKTEQRKLVVDFGTFFKEFIKWVFLISIMYVLAKYTRFPDEPLGNFTGSAIM